MDPAINRLKILSPLEGDWVCESLSAGGKQEFRKIRYRWVYDGMFFEGLSERYTEAGIVKLRITYFYDLAIEKIKVWTIASDGATSEALVQVNTDNIVLKFSGPTSQGKLLSLTSTLSFGNPRSELWSELSIDGVSVPDPPPILWTRVYLSEHSH